MTMLVRVPVTLATAVAAVWASTLLAALPADAGQPYRCVCKGVSKRFIASTYMCEKDLHKGSHKPVASGFTLYVKPCTKAQFQAWNAKACRSMHCKAPVH